jgi:hypothetical protein
MALVFTYAAAAVPARLPPGPPDVGSIGERLHKGDEILPLLLG